MSLISLDKNQMDLFFAFTGRHKRFLKLRETSFTAKQIEYGIDLSEKAVKAVQAFCKAAGMSPVDCIAKPAKKAAAAREIRKKATKLTPKQATYVLDNFEGFQLAVSLAQAPVSLSLKNVKKPAEYGDKYYQPTQHKYR